jgi:hypothetical protein
MCIVGKAKDTANFFRRLGPNDNFGGMRLMKRLIAGVQIEISLPSGDTIFRQQRNEIGYMLCGKLRID